MSKNGKPSKTGGLPLVSAAFICEKVLIEGGNVPTAVRIVDTVFLPPLGKLKITLGDLPESGVQMVAQVAVKWDKEGLYWFELSIGRAMLARVPLRIKFGEAVTSDKPPGS